MPSEGRAPLGATLTRGRRPLRSDQETAFLRSREPLLWGTDDRRPDRSSIDDEDSSPTPPFADPYGSRRELDGTESQGLKRARKASVGQAGWNVKGS